MKNNPFSPELITKTVPLPAGKIMMTLAPMMARSRGWKIGYDLESMFRMRDRYLLIASLEN